ncbi:ubiquitin thioesterase OTU1 [Gonapodya prolifera JEL478]|uniref:Ubiquitin thioesterase OTU n=1 Tax=Gonapodya prolifera (strain JEL478) TaxID=1344416 RepID=A0A139A5T8_GONPJ|nr:ubiquitin thioesterase OTU1 [Gonapodya prolifera JEL478]|eukprot:KXS12019.1 ubiquitin thioesterase OTU1 [Gonapodya prolifera JEL478]
MAGVQSALSLLGPQVVGAHLTAQSTLGELKADISTVSGTPRDLIVLKAGFPPKIVINPDTDSLVTCGIRDGEQLLLESSAPVQSPSTASSSASTPAPPKSSVAAPTSHLGPISAPSPVVPVPAPPVGHEDENGVAIGESILIVREQSDDNSCLFRSVAYVTEHDSGAHARLRKIVADSILRQPSTYSAAVLGQDPSDYVRWIQEPNSWGGAVELAILSEHFRVEIASVDVSTGRVDRFGEGRWSQRVFVIYSGIHYDAIAVTPFADAPQDFDQTRFGSDEEHVLAAARRIAEIWKRKKKFTDLANFTLRCGVCKKGLVGQKEAQAHALETGHASFTEYS